MSNQDNLDMGHMGGFPMENQPGMPMMEPYTQMTPTPMMQNPMTYRAVYPEICYKMKPYITMACDLMTSYGTEMPTQQQLEDMADGIYEDFSEAYPDMAEYMNKSGEKSTLAADPPPFRGGFRGFRPSIGFRRRGLARDFISALLLSELLNRYGNGYGYYPY